LAFNLAVSEASKAAAEASYALAMASLPLLLLLLLELPLLLKLRALLVVLEVLLPRRPVLLPLPLLLLLLPLLLLLRLRLPSSLPSLLLLLSPKLILEDDASICATAPKPHSAGCSTNRCCCDGIDDAFLFPFGNFGYSIEEPSLLKDVDDDDDEEEIKFK
jgi:hypothetical protein